MAYARYMYYNFELTRDIRLYMKLQLNLLSILILLNMSNSIRKPIINKCHNADH